MLGCACYTGCLMRKPARPGDPKKNNKCGVANSGCRFDGWLFFYLRALPLNMSQLNQGFGRRWNHSGDTAKSSIFWFFHTNEIHPCCFRFLASFDFGQATYEWENTQVATVVFFWMFFFSKEFCLNMFYLFFAVIDSMQTVVCLQMDNLEFHGYLKTLIGQLQQVSMKQHA